MKTVTVVQSMSRFRVRTSKHGSCGTPSSFTQGECWTITWRTSIGTDTRQRYRFAENTTNRSQRHVNPNRLSDKLHLLSSKLLVLEDVSTMPPSQLLLINPAAADDFPHLMAVGPAELSVSIGLKNGPGCSKLLGTLSD